MLRNDYQILSTILSRALLKKSVAAYDGSFMECKLQRGRKKSTDKSSWNLNLDPSDYQSDASTTEPLNSQKQSSIDWLMHCLLVLLGSMYFWLRLSICLPYLATQDITNDSYTS